MEAATETCWAASLTVQALTGRPLLWGLTADAATCKPPTPYYGWSGYDPVASQARDASPDELCQHAATFGLRRIIWVSDLRVATDITCADGKAVQSVPLQLDGTP